MIHLNGKAERKIAEMLFGKENLLHELNNFKAPAPLIVYCKNRKEFGFMGDIIDGFSQRFCNNFYPAPTDVGICMTQNFDTKHVVALKSDYSEFFKNEVHTTKTFLDGGNRNEENTFIIYCVQASIVRDSLTT